MNLLHCNHYNLLHVSATICDHIQGSDFSSKDVLQRYPSLGYLVADGQNRRPKHVADLQRLQCNKFMYFLMHFFWFSSHSVFPRSNFGSETRYFDKRHVGD